MISTRDSLREREVENEEEEFSNVIREKEEAAKQKALKSVLLSSIGATANGTASHLDGRMPSALPANLDPVQQAAVLGSGARSRTASNI